MDISLLIPESELSGTPPSLLHERIQALVQLLDDPLFPNEFRERVLFEVEVYKHFLPENCMLFPHYVLRVNLIRND